MTETERWVNETCELIVRAGQVRLYRSLYKDLRERLPCADACRLIEQGLRHTRLMGGPDDPRPPVRAYAGRARAIAALTRLARWADRRSALATLGRNDGQ